MNIMLTDIRALTPETPELAPADRAAAHGFTGMLRQQLPVAIEDDGQAIEFKGYFSDSTGSETDPETAPAIIVEANWREYLSQQQSSASVAADPLATAPAAFDEILQQRALPSDMATIFPSSTTATPGEILPASGNPLPNDASLDAAVFVAGKPSTVFETDQVAGLSQLSQSARSPLQLSVDASAAAPGSSVIGDDSIADTMNPGPAASLSKPLPLNSLAAGPTAGNPTDLGSVPGHASLAARVPGAFDTRVVPDAADTSRLTPLQPDLAKESVIAGASKPVSAAIPGILTSRENALAQQPARSRADVLNTQTESLSELRDAFKMALAPARANPEMMVIEGSGRGGAEIPTQAVTNTATPTLTAAPLPVATLASTAAVATGAAQMGLPGPLDTMILTRNPDSTNWGNGLGERVNWMINQKQNTATIRLDPPMLGKLDVQVRIADDATTIMIQTQHAQTRDLIESASLRLRDFLQESGYQNVNVDVSQRQDQQHTPSQSSADAQDRLGDDLDLEQNSDVDKSAQPGYFSGDGLVDIFA